jgi:hypothetical protein
MFVTKLLDPSKKVLRVILDRGVASGSDLQWATDLKPEELVTALAPLLEQHILGTSGGNPTSANGVLDSFFNLRPSARGMAEGLLNL